MPFTVGDTDLENLTSIPSHKRGPAAGRIEWPAMGWQTP